jgi:hypothetical protein
MPRVTDTQDPPRQQETITSRVPMAEPHILAAAMFRDQARAIERNPDGEGMRPQRKRAYIGAAVVEAQAFSETYINSFFWEALDGASMGAPGSPWNLGTTVGQALADAWVNLQVGTGNRTRAVKDATAEQKYQAALRVAGKQEFEPGHSLLGAATLRRRVRNALIHEGARFRVTYSTMPGVAVDETDWEKELKALVAAGDFEKTPTSHPRGVEQRAFFPDQLLSASFAHWCIRTAIELHDEFLKRLGFTKLRDLQADRNLLMPADFDTR